MMLSWPKPPHLVPKKKKRRKKRAKGKLLQLPRLRNRLPHRTFRSFITEQTGRGCIDSVQPLLALSQAARWSLSKDRFSLDLILSASSVVSKRNNHGL